LVPFRTFGVAYAPWYRVGLIEYTEDMYNEILDIGKTNDKQEILRSFNEAGYKRSSNHQKLSKFDHVGELFSDKCYPKRKLLCDSCNLGHCLNAETGTFLNSTIPTREFESGQANWINHGHT
jgi:hypothetical protein